MLRLKIAKRLGGANCNHIELVEVLDGEQIAVKVEFDAVRDYFKGYPGGYKGVLVELLAAYWQERGTSLNNLPSKVRIET